MHRTILAASAALLLSTGLGQAAGLVPGSDVFTRQEQAAADRSVVTGQAAARDRTEPSGSDTTFGYPAARSDRATPQTTRSGDTPRAYEADGVLVPGSDSF